MISFGQQLYNPTLKDQQTIQVDPYFRTALGTIAVGQSVSTAVLPIPVDRALMISGFNLQMNPDVTSKFIQAFLYATNQSGNNFPIFLQSGTTLNGDNAAGAAGTGICISRFPYLLIPPGTASLTFQCNRDVITGTTTFQLHVTGFLVPPGEIARLT